MNKNIFDMPNVPNKQFGKQKIKGKLLYAVIVLVLFLLLGVYTFLYWMFLLISAYSIIGWSLLGIGGAWFVVTMFLNIKKNLKKGQIKI